MAEEDWRGWDKSFWNSLGLEWAAQIHSTQDQLVGYVGPWERKLSGSLADSYVL